VRVDFTRLRVIGKKTLRVDLTDMRVVKKTTTTTKKKKKLSTRLVPSNLMFVCIMMKLK
jgi:hypothetical protein